MNYMGICYLFGISPLFSLLFKASPETLEVLEPFPPFVWAFSFIFSSCSSLILFSFVSNPKKNLLSYVGIINKSEYVNPKCFMQIYISSSNGTLYSGVRPKKVDVKWKKGFYGPTSRSPNLDIQINTARNTFNILSKLLTITNSHRINK